MFEFVQRFFGKPASSTTAKERLRLVLLSDHLSLAPDVVEALKRDLVEVISRYVEVDSTNCDVTFEQQDKQVAMLANIPILGMRQSRPRANGSAPPSPAPPSAPPPAARPPAPPSAQVPESSHTLESSPSLAPESPSFGAAGASAEVAHEPDKPAHDAAEALVVSAHEPEAKHDRQPELALESEASTSDDSASGGSRAQRRRRRKRAAAAGAASPQPT